MVKMPHISSDKCRQIRNNDYIYKSLKYPVLLIFLLVFNFNAKSIAVPAQQDTSDNLIGKYLSQENSKKQSSKQKISPLIRTPSSQLNPLSGNSIHLNDRQVRGAWLQKKQKNGNFSTYISDSTLKKLFGVDLLNTSNWNSQPVQWFSSFRQQQILPSLIESGYRYLDVTKFIKQTGWRIQSNGKTLFINTPQARVTNIIQTQAPSQKRVVINLNNPVPWEIRQEAPRKRKPLPKPKPSSALEAFIINSKPQKPVPKPPPPNRDWTISLDAQVDPRLVEFYSPKPPISLPQKTNQLPSQLSNQPVVIETPEPLIQKVEVVKNRTIIRLSVPFGMSPQISSFPKPNRLVIDIRPDAMLTRDIAWAPGIRWRQQFVNLQQERFATKWLEIDPSSPQINIKPIESETRSLIGTAPLVKTAQKYLASAAINGGFFNRKNRLPLGAIRRDGKWLSSPILNRGAIAWDNSGNFYMGRLKLEENLITSDGRQIPILTLNSGYVQKGIARYTPSWGSAYTPLTDNEIVLIVRNNRIVNQLLGNTAGENPIPIPQDGYLLTLRAFSPDKVSEFSPGTKVKILSSTIPSEFNKYPNIMGAGPLLLQNRQVVLDAKSENFSSAFSKQQAIRSGICTTNSGKLIVAAVHNRSGGKGPTLLEHAQLMQKMGCVNALNLDGGSSTSIYLGGELINRSSNTAARVHNAIGIFLQAQPKRK
ncbi:MAG: phosphodiester glycosidase family protein [Cyanobacteria bacterium P01_A01_bin.45]